MKCHSIFISLIFMAPVFVNASDFPVCGLKNRIQYAMSVVASNLANVDTTRTPEGGPYLIKELICASEDCELQEIEKIKRVYEPLHIDADAEGYVLYPDIDVNDEIAQMQMLMKIYEKAEELCRWPAVSNYFKSEIMSY